MPEQVLQWLDEHHDRVAAKCEGMTVGKELLSLEFAQTKVHD